MDREEARLKSNELGVTIAKNKRMMFWEDALVEVFDHTDKVWEEMLNDSPLYGPPKYTADDVDEYVRVKYTNELMGPRF